MPAIAQAAVTLRLTGATERAVRLFLAFGLCQFGECHLSSRRVTHLVETGWRQRAVIARRPLLAGVSLSRRFAWQLFHYRGQSPETCS